MFREFPERLSDIYLVMFYKGFKKRQEMCRRLIFPREDSTIPERKIGIRDNEVRIKIFLNAEAKAGRACSIRIIKREHPRRDLRIADSTIGTGKFLAEGICLFLCFYLDYTIRFGKGKFHCFKKPPFDTLSQGDPVNYDIYFMLLVFIKLNIL